MTEFVFRPCCTGPDRPPVSDRSVFLHRVDFVDPFAGAAVKTADADDLRPEWGVCLHEAGHAVFGYSLGFDVAEIVAGRGGYVQTVANMASWQDRVRFLMAGNVAAQLAHTDDPRPSRENYIKWLPHIRNLGGGACDECLCLRLLFINNRDASDNELISTFWQLEHEVIQTFKHPEIRAAVTALAHELMEKGRLSGEETNALLSQYSKGTENAKNLIVHLGE